jgi:hypothetical protein
MEPGGTDDHASYESWLGLGGHALIDCREHHEDSNRRAGMTVTRWHHSRPPIQRTWGALIRAVLAFEGRTGECADVAAYQRDWWGRTAGTTAVLEISALHAPSMNVDVERTRYRAERIAELKRQLEANQPRFALFYGTSYRREYETMVGPFNADGWRWSGQTLCVLASHPVSRPTPPAEYWRALGAWMRRAVAAGPGNQPPDSIPRPAIRGSASAPRTSAPVASLPARPRPVIASSLEFDPRDPRHTLEILEQLERHRFKQLHIRQLHHFGARASLHEHIIYCRGLRNRFTSQTNEIVARRLHRVLGYLKAGHGMEQALQRAISELPMPS